MSSKQPLISLDRPNNTGAIQSLQSPEITPADKILDRPSNGVQAVADNASAANDTTKPTKAPRKPSAPAPQQVVLQPAPSVPSPATTVERIVTLGARIPASLHQNIKLYCVGNGIEMQHFVQEALTSHLNAMQNK